MSETAKLRMLAKDAVAELRNSIDYGTVTPLFSQVKGQTVTWDMATIKSNLPTANAKVATLDIAQKSCVEALATATEALAQLTDPDDDEDTFSPKGERSEHEY